MTDEDVDGPRGASLPVARLHICWPDCNTLMIANKNQARGHLSDFFVLRSFLAPITPYLQVETPATLCRLC